MTLWAAVRSCGSPVIPFKATRIALEGLEYLASLNGFPSVLRFVQTLNEKVLVNESFLLVTVNPDAMKAQEYTLLATETAGEIEA